MDVDTQLYLIAVVAVGIVCGCAGIFICGRKGRPEYLGWWLGFLLGPIGLIIIACLASRKGIRKCPFCAESVKAEAVVCRYCGRDLPADQIPAPDPADELFAKWTHEK